MLSAVGRPVMHSECAGWSWKGDVHLLGVRSCRLGSVKILGPVHQDLVSLERDKTFL
jgi:hypothetical protein